jgi:hypothetical protein
MGPGADSGAQLAPLARLRAIDIERRTVEVFEAVASDRQHPPSHVLEDRRQALRTGRLMVGGVKLRVKETDKTIDGAGNPALLVLDARQGNSDNGDISNWQSTAWDRRPVQPVH